MSSYSFRSFVSESGLKPGNVLQFGDTLWSDYFLSQQVGEAGQT